MEEEIEKELRGAEHEDGRGQVLLLRKLASEEIKVMQFSFSLFQFRGEII